MTGGLRGTVRALVASLLVVSATFGLASLSSATPSTQDLAAAKAKLAALNSHLSLLVEQYDQARIALQDVEGKLADARRAATQAQAAAAKARSDLSDRAAQAYQGVGSELGLLLDAQSFAEFSDRLEFLGSVAQSDVDLATRARTARQRAEWATQQLEQAVQQRTAIVNSITQQTAEIRRGIADQKALVDRYGRAIREAERAAATASLSVASAVSSFVGTPPPAPNPSAQLAVNAAYSAIGSPYVYGGSSPNGFDCSGLAMWAWAHAGVSLPHSSAEQYAVLPHVATSDLVPGDLVFFYSPIHHVGVYVGGGQMIDASHPGAPVSLRPVEWDVYVGAARP